MLKKCETHIQKRRVFLVLLEDVGISASGSKVRLSLLSDIQNELTDFSVVTAICT